MSLPEARLNTLAKADSRSVAASATVPNTSAAGRSCPLHYRYRPQDMAVPAETQTEALYVVGGLYGNTAALDTLLALYERERAPKRLVFNGDFHWFDTDPAQFARIEAAVSAHEATRGNVETELADPHAGLAGEDAGCGCAYPGWVDEAVVERSNRIIARLRATARRHPGAGDRLAALPMWRRIDVGGARVAIVHGDAESLAGWGFAPEHLGDAALRARAHAWFDEAQVDVFASSHTCAPLLQSWGGEAGGPARQVLINNGAAGMPNLPGPPEGLVTRIALAPPADPVLRAALRHGRRLPTARGTVHIDALGLAYDQPRWHSAFLAQWPPGSEAHASYWARISGTAGVPGATVLRHDRA